MPDDYIIASYHQKDSKGISPNCKIPYKGIFLLENTGEILLLYKRNYEILISVCLIASKRHPLNFFLETDAGLSIV